MSSYPNPLIQYLGQTVSWSESYTSRTLSIKFAVNPAAMVEKVQLDLGSKSIMPIEWKYQLVSVPRQDLGASKYLTGLLRRTALRRLWW